MRRITIHKDVPYGYVCNKTKSNTQLGVACVKYNIGPIAAQYKNARLMALRCIGRNANNYCSPMHTQSWIGGKCICTSVPQSAAQRYKLSIM